MLHLACERGDIENLDDEQSAAVASCLDYVEALEKDADEVFKELRVEINI